MLDRVAFYHCITAEDWSMLVTSSDGKKTHTVSFGKNHKHENHVECDYSCTCEAYKYRKGYCKHIEAVKHLHCGWMQFIDGGEPVDKIGEKVCPRCGSYVSARMWAV